MLYLLSILEYEWYFRRRVFVVEKINFLKDFWAEDLPDACPPEDAYEPNNEVFYRLVNKASPGEKDFFSHRKRQPNRNYDADECIIRSLSVFNSVEACQKKKDSLAHFKRKKIAKITLNKGCGVVKQTGQDISHYSWWLAKNYDPIANCEIVS